MMRATNATPLIHLNGVTKRYQGQGKPVVALADIHLDAAAGEFFIITGKSGSGKTTLVNVVTGLDRATAGEIWVAGTPVHRLTAGRATRWRSQAVGVVFQSFALLPSLSVLQNVMLPMDFAGKYTRRERRARALHLLEQLGIAEHAHKPPTAVSGGQQQRVAIARALANDPPILVADEPTGSLDSATTDAVLRVFEDLVDKGQTVLLVTHDRDVAARGTRVVEIQDGHCS